MYKRDDFGGGERTAHALADPAASTSRWRGWVRAVVREPLTHFLLLGILIFIVAHVLETRSRRYTIDVGAADVARMVNGYEQQYGTEPNVAQLGTMIDNYIREEIYLREGLALGLDRNDEIVRRRVAQKYDFLLQDMAVPREPDEGQLRAYYAAHQADFAIPANRGFEQIYFAIDERGEQAARALAAAALDRLRRGENVASDEFPGPKAVSGLSQADTARLFGGQDFSARVFVAPVGDWTGPFRSGFGWHLVRVTNATPAQRRTLAQARDDVRAAWVEADRQARNATEYDALLKRYDISRVDRPQ